jgi:hypothetical protein
LKEVNLQINETKKLFMRLHLIDEHLKNYQSDLLEKMSNELHELDNSAEIASFLDIKKFKIEKYLSFFKNELATLKGEIKEFAEIYHTITRVEKAIATMLDIYNRIDHFKEQHEFVNFIFNITREEKNHGNQFGKEYKNQILDLKNEIQMNIIKERYEVALEAFKHWSFPFFCEYKKKLDLSPRSYAKNLKTLLETIRNDQDQLTLYDNYMFPSFSFENEFAFFKWSSKQYGFDMRRLLSGETATFYADIRKSEVSQKFDAIKFCTLYLLIEIKEESPRTSKHNELTSLLTSQFYIELVHTGESNYKFNGRYYSIESYFKSEEKLKLISQYGCKTGEKCENMNASFKKMAKSKPMLSPYTLWQFRIYSIDSTKRAINHQMLEKIRDLALVKDKEIIISLNGYGQYVSAELKNSQMTDNDSC